MCIDDVTEKECEEMGGDFYFNKESEYVYFTNNKEVVTGLTDPSTNTIIKGETPNYFLLISRIKQKAPGADF